MTDPQTSATDTIAAAIRPQTKAGQTLAARYGKGNVASAILAIEAEARTPYIENMQRLAEANDAYGREIDRLQSARADALREAADAVRALPRHQVWQYRQESTEVLERSAVLAILDPQP